MTFIESIYEKAKANKKTIAVPESTNEVMQKASAKIQADGIAEIILVGDPAAINAKAEELGLDISSIRIVDSADEDYKNALLDKYEASPYKVMGRKFIEKRIGDPVYLATLMEAVGEVDATIAGIDTTTYEFVLAANSIIGMAPGCVTASGLQILELEEFQGEKDKFIGISDGAINVEPTVEQHAGIAIASCDTFEAITGIEPKCAFLSYSTDGSGGMSAPVKKVRDAVALAQSLRPDLKIDGEFQFDAALVPAVGKKKVKRPSEVAGEANVLITPDASCCNICGKAIQFTSICRSYGPLYQGFRLPILDCSRGMDEIIAYDNIALLCVQAGFKK
ncbi:MAG: phosphate acetyltransferase [Lachnospiraceae bacterium]|nr:phosphate acetyltransferase [Lachnospiraceae bacterium]MBR3244210.1 phosphate acetyltransferase [Parasporobacterium sp.]MBR2843078.1 phosphate acetyltransferase [Lachnospiraceae bacterium]MBR3360185.1 phosphate acetyltransferase [Lachnospiraceae bacterium]MBR3644044.1 phosphate acetyltransferase [Parasporobacterium sp.]